MICVHGSVPTHVEAVCLLYKLHEAKHHVNVTLDMDELEHFGMIWLRKGEKYGEMSKEERAKQYLDLLKKNPSKQQAQVIANRLEGLVNADKGTPLSFSSKIAIWEEMEKQVSSSIVLEHADNQ